MRRTDDKSAGCLGALRGWLITALNYRKCLFNEASGSQATMQSGHCCGLGSSGAKMAAEEELSYDGTQLLGLL